MGRNGTAQRRKTDREGPVSRYPLSCLQSGSYLGELPVEDAYHYVTLLERLSGQLDEDDLPPFVERNAKKALACFWQVMNDCNLDPDQLYDLGV